MPDAVVGILVGSESDRERMEGATQALDEAGVGYEFEVRSAHRTPDAVAEYARTARERGLRVLICGAGLAAASAALTLIQFAMLDGKPAVEAGSSQPAAMFHDLDTRLGIRFRSNEN